MIACSPKSLEAPEPICVAAHRFAYPAVHSGKVNSKRKAMKFLMMAALALSLVLIPLYGIAQPNSNSSTGQMRKAAPRLAKPAKAWAET